MIPPFAVISPDATIVPVVTAWPEALIVCPVGTLIPPFAKICPLTVSLVLIVVVSFVDLPILTPVEPVPNDNPPAVLTIGVVTLVVGAIVEHAIDPVPVIELLPMAIQPFAIINPFTVNVPIDALLNETFEALIFEALIFEAFNRHPG